MDFKAGLYDNEGNAISGSNDLKITIKRDIDNYFYDFSDSLFKAGGWISISTQLYEPNVNTMPGEYEVSINTTGWNNGAYTAYIKYLGNPKWVDRIEFRTYDGKEATADKGEVIAEINANEAKIDTIIAGTDELQNLVSNGKIAAQVKGMDPSVFDSSALSTDAVNEIRDAIMNKSVDGTINVEECLKALLAVLGGNIIKEVDTYYYKDQSGVTKLTAVIGETNVTKTISH